MESVTDVVEEFTVIVVPFTVKLPVIVAFPSTDKSDAVSKPKSVKFLLCCHEISNILFCLILFMVFGVKKRVNRRPPQN